jgi:hypothetical protein
MAKPTTDVKEGNGAEIQTFSSVVGFAIRGSKENGLESSPASNSGQPRFK